MIMYMILIKIKRAYLPTLSKDASSDIGEVRSTLLLLWRDEPWRIKYTVFSNCSYCTLPALDDEGRRPELDLKAWHGGEG